MPVRAYLRPVFRLVRPHPTRGGQLEAYWQTVDNIKLSTVNQRLVALSRFFKWAVTQGHARSDPTADVRGLRLDMRRPRALDDVALRRLLRQVHQAGDQRDVALVVVRRGKGGVHRRVPLTAPVRKALSAYLEEHPELDKDDPLWVGQRGPLRDQTGVVKLLKWSAQNRSLETMRRIALDALSFEDDGDAFYTYADTHHLTVNEVAYYLNAYEAGEDAGLEAIRNPDIIPPEVAQRAIKTVSRTLDAHFQGRLPYSITDEGTGIGVYEIQQRMNGDRYLFAICQLRLTLASQQWHLYWMRKFDAWWPYPPPEKGHRFTLKAQLQQVLEDKHGCFFG